MADVDDLRPSAKRVCEVLKQEGPLQKSEILDRVVYRPSTVDTALSILIDEGLIDSEKDPSDARKAVYSRK